MFITRVIVVPVSKVAHFFVFFPDDRKRIWAHFGQNIYVYLKDLTEFFQKMVWLIGFRVTVCEMLRVEITKKILSQEKSETFYFQGFTSCCW